MNLVSIRIITENLTQLVTFYEQITGISVVQYTPDFAELQTATTTIAMGSTRTLSFFGGEKVAKASQNRSIIIEFKVDDVDKTYQKLADFLTPYMVQEPTTMPWGNRSLLFRDPDGHLVNLFTPISPEAIQKFSGK